MASSVNLKFSENDALTIEALARRLQTLPAECRWVYCQQDVIQAAARGAPVILGWRSRWVAAALKLAAKCGLEIVAAKIASAMLLAAVCWRPRRSGLANGRRSLFVGIGALREAELISQFEALCGGPASVIDQRPAAALAAIYRPGLVELARAWRDAALPVFADLAVPRTDPVFDRLHLLVYVVRRLHRYAHALAVFRASKGEHPAEIVGFSSADLPAFAAVRAGIETIYFQHGFLRHSLVFPDFSRAVSLNAPEAEHIKSRLPSTMVIQSAPVVRPRQAERRLAISGDSVSNPADSRDLIEFCRMAGIDVVVRPHPADRSGYWNEWEDIGGVNIDRCGTFNEFLDRHRPCVLATWYSTTIFDALLRGVVPVTFAANEADVVFPVSEVALAWPQQKLQVQAILAEPDARYEVLSRSLVRAIGPRDGRAAMEKFKTPGVHVAA